MPGVESFPAPVRTIPSSPSLLPSSSKCDYDCSWTPQTTARLLLASSRDDEQGGGGGSDDVDDDDIDDHVVVRGHRPKSSSAGWDVLDNVMTERAETDGGGGSADQYADFGTVDDTAAAAATSSSSSFSRCLYQELLDTNMLQSLQPARTQGDRRVDEIMDLLNAAAGRPPLGGDAPRQPGVAPSADRGNDARGDRSLFVDRDSRRRHGQQFAARHPYLHCLIDRVSSRIQREFCGPDENGERDAARPHDEDRATAVRLDLDLSMTSVQVAVYPGDGVSGYVRHCDRGQDSCREEQEDERQQPARQRVKSEGREEPQRLVTAVYYVTPDDWSATLDGGALRLFHTSNYNNNSGRNRNEEDEYTDITPHANRMVVFRSDIVQHQVLPSRRRPRTAVTLWFYGTIRGGEGGGAIATPSTDVGHPGDASLLTKMQTSSALSDSPLPTQLPPPLPIVLEDATSDGTDSLRQHHKPRHPTIFVSIASFRDSETRPTLDSLFENALYPQRVFVGVVLQLMTTTMMTQGSDGTDEFEYDERVWQSVVGISPRQSKPWMPHQVRYLRMDASDAMGPCYARGLCQTLYRGEDFALQIDSHMRFRKNWDEYLLQSLENCCRCRQQDGVEFHEKVLLTTYPVGYTLPNTIPLDTRGTYLLPWKFDSDGMLRQRGRLLAGHAVANDTATGIDNSWNRKPDEFGHPPSSAPSKCFRHYLYAGGFNFGAAHAVIDEVPYDTMGLQHLFFGEELSMAVRFYTHGYDLYAPEQTVCYHLWSRAHRPTFIKDHRQLVQDKIRKDSAAAASRDKVRKQLLGETGLIGIPYGLGTQRSASDFAKLLGVNHADHTTATNGRRWEDSDLSEEDFVARNHETLRAFEEGSTEARVASLDSKAKQLIGAFLQGVGSAILSSSPEDCSR